MSCCLLSITCCLQAELESSLASARKAGAEASSSADSWRTSAQTQQANFAARLKQLNMQVVPSVMAALPAAMSRERELKAPVTRLPAAESLTARRLQVATKMGALHNEQRVLRSAVEAELASARSACAAALDSSQVRHTAAG